MVRIVHPRITPLEYAIRVRNNLRRVVQEDRDLYPGEWFRLARSVVRAKRYLRQGYVPVMRPTPPKGTKL
jgi:hypothetical protein